MKTIFVTVGTTKFEQLINQMLHVETLDTFKRFGFNRLILQIGNGKHENENLFNLKNNNDSNKFYKHNIEILVYRFKNSLKEDLDCADLVISHAGAGSVLESLEANKKLIVVINQTLMNNHQLELAEKMYNERFLLYTTCANLVDQIIFLNSASASLTKYKPGNSKLFGEALNKLFII